MNKPKITICAVNWFAKDFAQLMVDSIVFKSKNINEIEIIIVDNSGELDWEKDFNKYDGITFHHQKNNLGHGAGLDLAIKEAKGEYILVLDIDSHILLQDWDEKLIKYFEDNKLDYMAGEGGLVKPVRPCVAFFRRDWFIDGKYSFVAEEVKCGNGNFLRFDVGVSMYHQAIHAGANTELFPYMKTQFADVFGNEYGLRGERFVYHNWYSCRWFDKFGKRVHDNIDNVKWENWKERKDNLFKQI